MRINMDIKEIRERIGFFRNKAHLSARALSLEIGKNESYINRLEAKVFEPSLELLLEIIDACGISAEEFFYHNPETYKTDMELLSIIKNLNQEQKQSLKKLLENK